MSGFSYRNTADITFYKLDVEYFLSHFIEHRDIKNTSTTTDYNISGWDKYRPPTKLEDIYGLERSKKWINEFLKPLWE